MDKIFLGLILPRSNSIALCFFV